jgi:hypothetical protein
MACVCTPLLTPEQAAITIAAAGGCGDYDYSRYKQRVGLRRIAWVQSGLNKFNALPDNEE